MLFMHWFFMWALTFAICAALALVAFEAVTNSGGNITSIKSDSDTAYQMGEAIAARQITHSLTMRTLDFEIGS